MALFEIGVADSIGQRPLFYRLSVLLLAILLPVLALGLSDGKGQMYCSTVCAASSMAEW